MNTVRNYVVNRTQLAALCIPPRVILERWRDRTTFQPRSVTSKACSVSMKDSSAGIHHFGRDCSGVRRHGRLGGSQSRRAGSHVVQLANTMHNVHFKTQPSGSRLGSAAVSPYLTTKGQAYTVVVDSRFGVGRYEIVCDPHEMIGMKAILTVEAPLVK